MLQAVVPDLFSVVTTNTGWSVAFELVESPAATPLETIPLEIPDGVTFELYLQKTHLTKVTSLDLSAFVSLDENVIWIDVPRATTDTWPAGVYEAQLRIIDPTQEVDFYEILFTIEVRQR